MRRNLPSVKPATWGLGALLVLGLLGWGLWQKSGEPQGKLEIGSFPAGVAILIDGEQIGATPWQGSLAEGWHEVTLRPTDVAHPEPLERTYRVELTEGCTSLVYKDLTKVSELGQHYVLSCQKRGAGSLKPVLGVATEQKEVTLYLDAERNYILPHSFRDLTPRRYELSFAKEGYETLSVPIKISHHLYQTLQVELARSVLKRPVQVGPELSVRVSRDQGSTEEIPADLDWVPYQGWATREPWQGVSMVPEAFTPWQKIRFYRIVEPSGGEPLVNELSAIDLISAIRLRLQKEGIEFFPYAYAVSEAGYLYQALFLQNFDFSRLATYWRSEDKISGVVPVLYLSDRDQPTDLALKTLNRLAIFLGSVPDYQATLLTELDPVVLGPGEVKTLKLTFQNQGSQIWRRQVDEDESFGIGLVTVPRQRVSEFYYPPDWRNSRLVGTIFPAQVVPGQVTEVGFSLRGPLSPGFFQEEFGLWNFEQGQLVLGSQFVVSIEVKVAGEVVEIMKTPTGFLNVRRSPSLQADLIGTVYPGERFILTDEISGWYQIRLKDGNLGYIYAAYAHKP